MLDGVDGEAPVDLAIVVYVFFDEVEEGHLIGLFNKKEDGAVDVGLVEMADRQLGVVDLLVEGEFVVDGLHAGDGHFLHEHE